MKNKECDIIKDLLPSYVDEICSEASKEWIEEHLKSCGECKRTAEMLKHTELSAKRLEQESLDAGRKVIRQNLRRSVLNFGLCLLLVVLMAFIFSNNRDQVPLPAVYAALPICMLMSWLVGRNQVKERAWDRGDTALLLTVLAAAGYGVFMMLYGFSRVAAGEDLWRVPRTESGPFLYSRMVGAAVVCFLIYLVQMVRIVKQGRAGSVLMNLCLTGIFLMMAYCVHMGYITDLELALASLKNATKMTLAIGAAGTIGLTVIDKLTKK